MLLEEMKRDIDAYLKVRSERIEAINEKKYRETLFVMKNFTIPDKE